MTVVTAILPLPRDVLGYALDAALLAAGIPPSSPGRIWDKDQMLTF